MCEMWTSGYVGLNKSGSTSLTVVTWAAKPVLRATDAFKLFHDVIALVVVVTRVSMMMLVVVVVAVFTIVIVFDAGIILATVAFVVLHVLVLLVVVVISLATTTGAPVRAVTPVPVCHSGRGFLLVPPSTLVRCLPLFSFVSSFISRPFRRLILEVYRASLQHKKITTV